MRAKDLRKRLMVKFKGEEGLDYGGVARYFCKTCLKLPLKRRPKIGFQDRLSLNAGQKYCRMLQGGHSAILLTCIKR